MNRQISHVEIWCSVDNTLIAIVRGNWPKGSVPPPDAYELIGGVMRNNMGKPILLCTNEKHGAAKQPPRVKYIYEDES